MVKSTSTPFTVLSGTQKTDDAILVKGIRHCFIPVVGDILHDIDLTIHFNQITGLAGPDGAGKTTLMRIMAGLLTPTAGKVQVMGFDPATQAQSVRSQIGYMPQKFGLYEDLTVIENLNLYADLRHVTGQEKTQQFEQLLTFTSLNNFTNRMAGKLSGGMKQKLGLACALLGKPKVLLLDEPGVGVDPISRRELWAMVAELATQGLAIVWATAYLDEAQQCDDLCLMNNGKVVFKGHPTIAIKRMQGRSLHVKQIQGSRRRLLQRALTQPEVIDGVIQGSAVRLVIKQKDQWPSLQALAAGQHAVIEEVSPRLEDMFIDILGGGPSEQSIIAQHMPEVILPADVNPSAVIAVRDLTRRFGRFVATDHVSFEVKKGEIFGLIGPNGAGKSTTFKMLCGLLAISDGQASVMGIDLKKSAPVVRQRLGYMAQKFSLYRNLSVSQNLAFFSGIYGLRGKERQERIAEMVSCFNLGSYLNSTTDELPLGYKQRLALACALMHKPQILFLDEPTSGVDPITRREFWAHINGLVDKGVTILVTTHFMDEAEYCDRIALIHSGKAIALGTTEELKQSIARPDLPDPTMEDAFVELIQQSMHALNTQQKAAYDQSSKH